ncbi:MAG TPA: hypothetical protein VKF62_00715, partial [Planctomycetota bacterium]|nr:hypothetical protein [Planctomycetota bacterium]
FRKVVPVSLPLLTRPSFDFGEFARLHPETPFHAIRRGLAEYLEAQRRRGIIAGASAHAAGLTLFSSLHCLAFFERVGVHGGRFDDAVIRDMVRTLWTGLAPRERRIAGRR